MRDPKPRRRSCGNPDDWQRIRAAKHGRCRACHHPGWIDLHHLAPRSQGGDDTEDNVIPLCHPCHMAYTNHTSEWPTIATRIRSSLTVAEAGYVAARKGDWWLDKHYPKETT